jgi:hypothetical protein
LTAVPVNDFETALARNWRAVTFSIGSTRVIAIGSSGCGMIHADSVDRVVAQAGGGAGRWTAHLADGSEPP